VPIVSQNSQNARAEIAERFTLQAVTEVAREFIYGPENLQSVMQRLLHQLSAKKRHRASSPRRSSHASQESLSRIQGTAATMRYTDQQRNPCSR